MTEANLQYQGIQIPRLGFGTWKLKGEDCRGAVQEALDIGYRHIDTAQMYENEREVGQAIDQSPVPRSEIFLTTKIWRDSMREGDLQHSLENSLRRLGMDYVDLTLLHWPVEEVPFEETMRALEDVQRQGKTRLIGISNFNTDQMKRVVNDLGAPVVTNQVEYHPLLNQDPVLSFLRNNGMFLTAYSPLARNQMIGDNRTFRSIAENHGKTPQQIALRWLVQQPDVAAIPKAGRREHAEQNIDIFDFSLSPAEMERISELRFKQERLVEPSFAPQWDTPRKAG